ncbi:MAG: CvpA family protein [Tidjanibacter sp.]|nr:CvpA family protein [Tidjanibacter sp.]
MNVLDIILAILLVVGAVNGFRKGIISQLCGLAGVLLGVWLGFKFGDRLGVWLGVEIGEIASFVIIFIGAVLLAALAGRISAAILRATGLGILNRLGGMALSLVEYVLICSLLLGLFQKVNNATGWVEPKVVEESVLVEPVMKVSEFVFPYLVELKDAIVESDSFKLNDKPQEAQNQEI